MKRYKAWWEEASDAGEYWTNGGEVYLCTDVDALLAQCEEALEMVRDWRGLDGDGISDPTWNRVLFALTSIRAARVET
jgi:hypothetical protein